MLLLATGSVGAQTALNTSIFHLTGRYETTTCDICGKTLDYWVEDSSSFDGGYYLIANWMGIDERRSLVYLICVCGECDTKYRAELADLTNKWLAEKQELHKGERQANEDARQQAEIERVKQKIENLKGKLKELK